jgi:dynein heavy chain
MDSTRAEWLMEKILNIPLKHEYRKQLLLIGGAGTAKTSTILMYTNKLKEDKVLKKMNFSSATTPRMF